MEEPYSDSTFPQGRFTERPFQAYYNKMMMMSPTMEELPDRIYWVRCKDGKESSVRASTICEPGIDSDFYIFKLDGQVVAKYRQDEVTGWRVAEGKPPS